MGTQGARLALEGDAGPVQALHGWEPCGLHKLAWHVEAMCCSCSSPSAWLCMAQLAMLMHECPHALPFGYMVHALSFPPPHQVRSERLASPTGPPEDNNQQSRRVTSSLSCFSLSMQPEAEISLFPQQRLLHELKQLHGSGDGYDSDEPLQQRLERQAAELRLQQEEEELELQQRLEEGLSPEGWESATILSEPLWLV